MKNKRQKPRIITGRVPQLSEQKLQVTNYYEINRKLTSVSFQPWETTYSPYIPFIRPFSSDHKTPKTVNRK